MSEPLWKSFVAQCPSCEGRRTWPQNAPPKGRTRHPKDQTSSQSGGPWRTTCGECRGTGYTSGGKRTGSCTWFLAPGFSHCMRCATPWAFVCGHSTDYGHGGIFPLCEECWAECSIAERLVFYEALWLGWNGESMVCGHDVRPRSQWDLIEAAVRAGL